MQYPVLEIMHGNESQYLYGDIEDDLLEEIELGEQIGDETCCLLGAALDRMNDDDFNDFLGYSNDGDDDTEMMAILLDHSPELMGAGVDSVLMAGKRMKARRAKRKKRRAERKAKRSERRAVRKAKRSERRSDRSERRADRKKRRKARSVARKQRRKERSERRSAKRRAETAQFQLAEQTSQQTGETSGQLHQLQQQEFADDAAMYDDEPKSGINPLAVAAMVAVPVIASVL